MGGPTTPNAEQYDAVVPGSGEGGEFIGWQLASQGKRVAVVERKYRRASAEMRRVDYGV